MDNIETVTCEFCGQDEMTFEEYTEHVKQEHAFVYALERAPKA